MLADFLRSNPYSEHYVFPPGRTAKDLVRLLLARQKAVFGLTIIERGDLPYTALLRNMRALMKTYSIDDLKRAIELSVWNGDHPASTLYLETQLALLDRLRNIPMRISSG